MLLTGASRGIGHATVKRFSAAGWRVITCSRHAFPENCPWEMGPEDHLQVDLASPEDTLRAVEETKHRLEPEGGPVADWVHYHRIALQLIVKNGFLLRLLFTLRERAINSFPVPLWP